jgi:hypothetical protein
MSNALSFSRDVSFRNPEKNVTIANYGLNRNFHFGLPGRAQYTPSGLKLMLEFLRTGGLFVSHIFSIIGRSVRVGLGPQP